MNNPNKSAFRGLSNFIAEIRECKTPENEKRRIDKELGNIRKKFKEAGKLSDYDKKKYVWKIMYIHMLGYDIDFGHMEALNLITCEKFSEKQVGYMACSLLLNETSEFLRLVINSVRKDIVENKNELIQSLALSTVANIGSKEFAESMANDVQRLLISPKSARQPGIKKKAALCLLKMYRRHSDIIDISPEFISSVLKMLETKKHMGVVNCMLTLISGIAQRTPDPWVEAVPLVVHLLGRLVLDPHDIPAEYRYAGFPCPWLQVKALRFLQFFPHPDDPKLAGKIRDILNRIITQSETSGGNRVRGRRTSVSRINITHAILFEAIHLCLHYDAHIDRDILIAAVNHVGKFMSAKDPIANVRYLALDTMCRLSAVEGMKESLQQYLAQTTRALRDRDVSIRRRALDLMYNMCDESNSRAIVGEMVNYLQSGDFDIREELVLRAAILAENFATDLKWYVDTVLELIAQAGDAVSDDVSSRVVRIITNREGMQAYAAEKIFYELKSPTVNETMFKVGSYILGEFGHLVADKPGFSPAEQFELLMNGLQSSGLRVKAIILSSLAKFANLYPEVKDRVLQTLRSYNASIDAELQQRAVEYEHLSSLNNVTATVLDQMPNFPEERENRLLKHIKESSGEDEFASWDNGDEDADEGERSGQTVSLDKVPDAPHRAAPTHTAAAPAPAPAQQANAGSLLDLMDDAPPAAAASQPSDIASDLAALGIGGGAAQQEQAEAPGAGPATNASLIDDLDHNDLYNNQKDLHGHLGAPARPRAASSVQTNDRWLRSFATAFNGVLFESEAVQIGCKSEFRGRQGRMAIYVGNKTDTFFSSVKVHLPDTPGVRTQLGQPLLSVGAKQQGAQSLMVEATGSLSNVPTMSIVIIPQGTGMNAAQPMNIALKLPIFPSKFMEPMSITGGADFMGKWNQIGAGQPRENVVVIDAVPSVQPGAADIAQGCQKFALPVIQGVDPNPNNAVAAATVCGSPCLVRVETNANLKKYRVTVRSVDAAASSSVAKCLAIALANPNTLQITFP